MAYQAIPPVTGGGFDPASVALRRARSLLGMTINKVIGTDFDNDQWYRTSVSGTGAVAITTTDRGGVVSLTTGATNSATADVTVHGTTVSIASAQTDLWYAVCRMIVTTAIDAQAKAMFRLVSSAIGNPQIALGIRGNQSTANFAWAIFDNSAVLNDSGTTSTAIDTSYHLLEMYGDATTIFLAIDGAQVGSSAATNAGTNPVTIDVDIQNGSTNAARTAKLDYMFLCCADPIS